MIARRKKKSAFEAAVDFIVATGWPLNPGRPHLPLRRLRGDRRSSAWRCTTARGRREVDDHPAPRPARRSLQAWCTKRSARRSRVIRSRTSRPSTWTAAEAGEVKTAGDSIVMYEALANRLRRPGAPATKFLPTMSSTAARPDCAETGCSGCGPRRSDLARDVGEAVKLADRQRRYKLQRPRGRRAHRGAYLAADLMAGALGSGHAVGETLLCPTSWNSTGGRPSPSWWAMFARQRNGRPRSC